MKKNNDNYSFQIQLLLDIINIKNYPFTKLIIEQNLTENEYQELSNLLENLNEDYHKQKQEGLMFYSSLLLHFVGMLNEKLLPSETIYALKQEGFYIQLMEEFIKIMNNEQEY